MEINSSSEKETESVPPPQSGFPQFQLLFAIDPGPRNTGWALFDRKKKKIVSAKKHAFREKQSKNDPKKNVSAGNLELINSVKKWCKENDEKLGNADVCFFVEDQIMGRLNYTWEPSLIQTVIYTLYGPPIDRCVIVPPHSVKSHFRQYFPRLERKENETESAYNERQYRFDKSNSVKYGKKFISEKILDELEEDKLDDVMDAVWIALYIDELMDGKPSHSEIQKEEKKQEKQKEKEEKMKKRKEEKEVQKRKAKDEKSEKKIVLRKRKVEEDNDEKKKKAIAKIVEKRTGKKKYEYVFSETKPMEDEEEDDLVPLSKMLESYHK